MGKKWLWIVLGVIGGILAISLMIGMYGLKIYNNLVQQDEQIKTQWAQVENQMQRRYDLIPNLVNTVKGYAKHEKEVFEHIADARAQLGGAKTPQDKMKASNAFEGALSRLLVITERYPDLKANENFQRLMDELAGTENRMSQERRRYNEMVQAYNITIRTVPQSYFAKKYGFSAKLLFQVEAKVKQAPKVDFNS